MNTGAIPQLICCNLLATDGVKKKMERAEGVPRAHRERGADANSTEVITKSLPVRESVSPCRVHV